MGGNR